MEKFELVDINGNPTGKIVTFDELKTMEKPPEGKYISVVKVIIINPSNKKILFQKRSMEKKMNPGKWGLCGGKVDIGEDTLSAAIRETYEEIGIELNKESLKYLCKYNTTRAIFTVYYVEKNINIDDCKIQVEELDELKYFGLDELSELNIEGIQWLEELKNKLYE